MLPSWKYRQLEPKERIAIMLQFGHEIFFVERWNEVHDRVFVKAACDSVHRTRSFSPSINEQD
jgi:hypothetical protein